MKAFLISRFAGLIAAACTGGIAAAATAAAVSSGAAPYDLPTGPGALAAYVGTGVTALVVAALKLRTFLSRNSVNLTADNYLRESLEQSKVDADVARRERDQAKSEVREAWTAANANAVELGQLRAENAYLRKQLADQSEAIAAIRRGVQHVGQQVDTVQSRLEETTKVTNSGIAPLGEQ